MRNHSLSIFAIGLSFALAGIGLFAFTLRKGKAPELAKAGVAMKKSQQRELEAERRERQAESTKIRIAGALCTLLGAAVMILS